MKTYSKEFKLNVVKDHIVGEGGAKLLGCKHGVSEEKVRMWVSRFRLHGEDGLCAVDTRLSFKEADFSGETLTRLPPVQLSFLEHAHELKTFDGSISGFHQFKVPHRVDQAFELTMIGFDNIIQIFYLSVHGVRWTLPFDFHLSFIYPPAAVTHR